MDYEIDSLNSLTDLDFDTIFISHYISKHKITQSDGQLPTKGRGLKAEFNLLWFSPYFHIHLLIWNNYSMSVNHISQ